jgi:hypothetical protein
MKTIITTLILLITIPVFTQGHYIGGLGGVSLTNVSSDNFFSDNDSRIGYLGGISYEYKLSNKFHFGIDFIYAQKGFNNSEIYVDTSDKKTGIEGVSVFNYDYFSIPIKGGVSMGDNISGFVNLGLVPSFLYNAQTIIPTIETINGKVIDVADKVTKMDFSAMIEVGGEYTFKKKFFIFASLAYQKSFTSITNEYYYANGKATHYGVILSLGVRYALKSEKPAESK